MRDPALDALRVMGSQEKLLALYGEMQRKAEMLLDASNKSSDAYPDIVRLSELRRDLLANWQQSFAPDYVEYLELRIRLEAIQANINRKRPCNFEKQLIYFWEELYRDKYPDSSYSLRYEQMSGMKLFRYNDYRAYRKAVLIERDQIKNLTFFNWLGGEMGRFMR